MYNFDKPQRKNEVENEPEFPNNLVKLFLRIRKIILRNFTAAFAAER
jgi:hypothetical protein